MARAVSKAKRAHNLSIQREIAYKEAVAIYKAEHRAYAASTDPKRRRPCSLQDIANCYGKLARKLRRKEDLEAYEAELKNWEEETIDWPRGMGRKPAKPVKPKVRKEPLTEGEIASVMAVIDAEGEAEAAESRTRARGASVAIVRELDSPESDGDDETNDGDKGDGSVRSTSPEVFDFGDDDSEEGD